MDHKLSLIQYQLWAIIGLFALFVVTNVLCTFANRKLGQPNFIDLWERGELEKLLAATAGYRQMYPNNADAHYFAIKALVATGRFAEAKELAVRLQTIEPGLAGVTQEWLDLIAAKQGG